MADRGTIIGRCDRDGNVTYLPQAVGQRAESSWGSLEEVVVPHQVTGLCVGEPALVQVNPDTGLMERVMPKRTLWEKLTDWARYWLDRLERETW